MLISLRSGNLRAALYASARCNNSPASMPFAKLHLKVMPGSPHFVLLLVLSAILSLVRPVLADNAGTIQFASDSYDVFESSGSVT
ncbi:MAG: hypothetical protein ACXWGY_06525, partial [Chthoniobacterales bacterium]